MTRFARRVALLTLAVLVCSAHIGSPDAWYDGAAGPYKVLVHVQAPPVVPGIAVVNVRATDPGIDKVTAFVNKFDATGGTPPPDVAAPVAEMPGWFRTRLWVMTAGSNSVTVAVHGTKGDGSVVVPLVAVAGRRLGFDPRLAGLLMVLGIILALGIVTIVGAAVREGVLPPGIEPDATHRRRARFAMARAVVVFVLAMTGTAAWWRSEDAAFTRNLFTPLAVTTRIDSGAGQRRFRLAITDSAWIHRNDIARFRARGEIQRGDFIEDHGKLMHLFLISADGRSAFAHLHPSTADMDTFTTVLPAVPAGSYSVFADVVHGSGLTETLTSMVTLAPGSGRSLNGWPADSDDSWAMGRSDDDAHRAVLQDGTTLTWLRNTTPLIADEEADLRFAVAPPPNDHAGIDPYLGMAGHAAIVRADGKVFIHLHPLGTISLAAQARLASAVGGPMSESLPRVEGGVRGPSTMPGHAMNATEAMGDTLYFPYAFPQPGTYTIWVQLKRHSRVLTGSFVAEVGPARK